jgi:hypothetical protein
LHPVASSGSFDQPQAAMIIFCNPMHSGLMEDDQFFIGEALRYSDESCNHYDEAGSLLQGAGMAGPY